MLNSLSNKSVTRSGQEFKFDYFSWFRSMCEFYWCELHERIVTRQNNVQIPQGFYLNDNAIMTCLYNRIV